MEKIIDNQNLSNRFAELSTPLIADACLRLGGSLRVAPVGIHPLRIGSHIAGGVVPVRHYGSVDIFLEAMETAKVGDVLVIDDGGRTDEGCIGNLTVLEAQACGLAGIVLWGSHRDTVELRQMSFPVFSYHMWPVEPQRLDRRDSNALKEAGFGDFVMTSDDVVFADEDGVIFVPGQQVEEILVTAHDIWQTERSQVQEIQKGIKLRKQFRFKEYLTKRSTDPSYTFRQHLRNIGGAIEE